MKVLVGFVGGSTSGFSAVVGAYVSTVTATIAVSAICALLAIMMYSVRADQRLRQDLRYGGAYHSVTLNFACNPGLHQYSTFRKVKLQYLY